jgi:hypothetical protein
MAKIHLRVCNSDSKMNKKDRICRTLLALSNCQACNSAGRKGKLLQKLFLNCHYDSLIAMAFDLQIGAGNQLLKPYLTQQYLCWVVIYN